MAPLLPPLALFLRGFLTPGWRTGLVLQVLALATGVAAAAEGPTDPGTTPGPAVPVTVRFNRDIRPILADKCFQCHGPDATPAQGQAPARHAATAATAPAASGSPAIVPGKLDESELYRRITSRRRRRAHAAGQERQAAHGRRGRRRSRPGSSRGPSTRGTGRSSRPVRPELPDGQATRLGAATRSTRFILARLEKEGLTPSPEADKVTLLRRLSLDLIGLPPTLAEVDAFLADTRAGRLREAGRPAARLAPLRRALGPASGSTPPATPTPTATRRTSRARSGSTATGSSTPSTATCPTTSSSSSSSPATCCPTPTQDQVVATGFLRNSMINEEGGIDPEQFRMEAMFDRMDAIGKGVLGLTIQCAQCHSHKYDPLTQDEYYRLFAFLNNTHEANVAVYTPDEQMKRAEIFRQIREIEADLQHAHARLAGADGRRGKSRSGTTSPTGRSSGPTSTTSRPAARSIYRMTDGSFLAAGLRADQAHGRSSRRRPTCRRSPRFRLELLNDPNLPLGGPGRSIKGTVRPDRVRGRGRAGRRAGQKTRGQARRGRRPTSTRRRRRSSRSSTTRAASSGSPARSPSPSTARTRRPGGSTPAPAGATCRARRSSSLEKPIALPGGTILTFTSTQNHGGWNSDDNQNNNLGRFRLSVTDRPGRRRPTRCREASARSWRSRPSSAPPAQVAAVFGYWRTTVPEWKEANDRIEALWKQHPEGSSQLVLEARDEPRTTHVLKRGDFLKPGKPVEPGVPAFLHPLPTGRAAEPPDVRALAGRPQVADDGARRSSTGSGRRTSAPASSRTQRGPRHRRASRRRIPSCSTGWPSSSWTAAGASSTCTG